MEWYLKKEDGDIYGPVAIQNLTHWSTEGRLSPQDQVSTNKESWQPVSELPELGMDWLVHLPGGEEYGPMHMMALAHLVDDGAVEPTTTVRHKSSGESYILSEALLGVLMDRNASIQASFDAMNMQLLELEAELQSLRKSPETSPHDDTDTGVDFRRQLKELASRSDMAQKEATKWKNLYENERSNATHKIDQLNTRIEELRQSDAQGRTRLEETARRLKQLEHSYSTLLKAADAATGPDGSSEVARQFGDLLDAYGQMSRSYDKLYEQLQEKVRECEHLVASRSEVEERAQKIVQDMEVVMQREKTEAEAARKQLTETQEMHFQMVKSFRDMNDRFIQLRQEWANKQVAKPTTRKTDAADAEDDKGGRGPRIRLNR